MFKLKRSINRLRKAERGLADTELLVRLQALELYMSGLGGASEGGLGFAMMSKRITYGFVCVKPCLPPQCSQHGNCLSNGYVVCKTSSF